MEENLVTALQNFLPKDYKDVAKHANNKNIAQHLRNIFPYLYLEDHAKGFIKIAFMAIGNFSNV
jgi:hypothetical protein